MSAHRCIRCKAEKEPDPWYWYAWLPHPDEPANSQYWVLCKTCHDELVKRSFIRELAPVQISDAELKTHFIGEDVFLNLRDAGVFKLILDHPDFGIYHDAGALTVHVPDSGAVQIVEREGRRIVMGRVTRNPLREICATLPKYDCKVYIETGLWHGNRLLDSARCFEVAHGIELNDHWFKVVQERAKARRNITVHHGDSREILPALLKQYADKPCFFYLDAHYCQLDPPIQKSEFPLWEELDLIRQRDPNLREIVLVDDVHTFGKKRPDLRYKDGAVEWEAVTTQNILDRLGSRVKHSQIVSDGFVVWI